jgi:hypothetical protein
MSPSDSKAGMTPLASKPAMNATADLKKGLRWRLKYSRTSPAWMTNGRNAADVLLKKIASEELRRHLLFATTLHTLDSVATMTLGTRENSREDWVEGAAQAYQNRDEEIGLPTNPTNLPRTRGGRRR